MSDRELLAETRRVVDVDRQTTAVLLALLAEVDLRKLYRGEGHSSLFTYCTHVLRLSEPAAYSRITAARAARRFPIILSRLAYGDVTLTTVTLLAAHLTDDNHEHLLDAARHKSKRDVERLIAAIDPQPDVVSSIRQRPIIAPHPERALAGLSLVDSAASRDTAPTAEPSVRLSTAPAPASLALRCPPKPAVIAPLSPKSYLVKLTVSKETHDKFQRARDLLRHSIPNGDPAVIVDRALTVLIAQLENTKHGAAARPRPASAAKSPAGRYIPAAVKRAVWARDGGRCAFVGTRGRCPETGLLEFHHVVPFAAGGATSVENLVLRCRSHNAHEAEQFFGSELCPDRAASTRACHSRRRRPRVEEVRPD